MAVLLGLAVIMIRPELVNAGRAVPAGSDADVVAWMNASLFDQALRTARHRLGAMPTYYAELDGGVPLGAHPWDGTASPLTWLLLGLSALSAVKIKALLGLWAGALGAYLLGRRLGAGRPASFAAALLVPLSGWATRTVASAPLDAQALWVLPALAVLLHAPATWFPVVFAAVFAALSAFQTGSLALAAVVVFSVAALARSLTCGERRLPFVFAFWTLLVAFTLGAARWVPAVEFLNAREWLRAAQLSAPVEPTVFLDRLADLIHDFSPGGVIWTLPVVLIAAARGFRLAGSAAAVAMLLAFFAAWSLLPDAVMGNGAGNHIWLSLRPFSTPGSIAPAFGVFATTGLAALGLERLAGDSSAFRRCLVVLVFAALIAASSALVDERPTREVPTLPSHRAYSQDVIAKSPFFSARTRHFLEDSDSPLEFHPLLFLENGMGVRNALRPYRGARRANHRIGIDPVTFRPRRNPVYQGEAWVQYRRGVVEAVQDEADGLTVTVNVEKDRETLVINRNFDIDWSAEPLLVFPARGAAAVRFDAPGRHVVRFQYRARAWRYGLGITGAAIVMVLASGLAALRGASKVRSVSGKAPTDEDGKGRKGLFSRGFVD